MSRAPRIHALSPVRLPVAGTRRRSAPRFSGAGREQALVRAKALAPKGLAPLLEPLSLQEVLATRRAIYVASPHVSFSQLLAMLPPKVAAKLLASRNEALMQFLLAWGKDLRAQAILAQKTQKRNDAKAQVIKHHEAQRAAHALQSGRAEAARAALQANVFESASRRRPQDTSAQGPSATMQDGLLAPLRSGYALRGSLLRFSFG